MDVVQAAAGALAGPAVCPAPGGALFQAQEPGFLLLGRPLAVAVGLPVGQGQGDGHAHVDADLGTGVGLGPGFMGHDAEAMCQPSASLTSLAPVIRFSVPACLPAGRSLAQRNRMRPILGMLTMPSGGARA